MPALTYAHRRPNVTAFAGVMSVTLMSFIAIGATLPVLPRYVAGPLGGGDVAVGLVAGAFAFTAIIFRPIGGRWADARGRKPVVLAGIAIVALSGLLLLPRLGTGGIVAARLLLGIGQGWVFTAGLAWAIDLSPPRRRGQAIGFYGLGVWGGLSFGPLIGEAAFAAWSYDAVWIVSAVLPLAGAVIAARIPDRHVPGTGADDPAAGGLLPRAAVRPGVALLLGAAGYATLTGFVILHLDERGIGHGAAVFTAFATTVVGSRLLLGWLPDRFGSAAVAAGAGLAQAAGLVVLATAQSLPAALGGALLMGGGFSLNFPALALLVVERVDERRRGAAMAAYTAFFDLGVGVGAPLAGAISALAGYPAAFGAAAVLAAAGATVSLTARSSPARGR